MDDNLNNLYENELYCMEFSNDEIAQYLVEPIKAHLGSEVGMYATNSDGEIEEIAAMSGEQRAEYVVFDKSNTGFYARFDGIQTSLFFALNEIMFIDDNCKAHYTADDTFTAAVYEGTLRDKTHAQILQLIAEIAAVAAGAADVEIDETPLDDPDAGYPRYAYNITLTNDSGVSGTFEFGNIRFSVN